MNIEEEEKLDEQNVQENDNSAETEEAPQDTENEEQEAEEEDETAKLKAEVATLQDKYLRSVAEFDNYRKRTTKEKAELILNGGANAIKAILPVLDDMERAIANGEKTEDPQVLREGMELIYQKFQKALEGLGVKQIDTKDADFDVDIHEAVAMVPGVEDDKKGKVIDCLQQGYKLNDKVIRHAKVAVGQ
ncbi:MAG: nucleotide exchange factor GrpE [Prevotella sp.]|nr:nucleotide exchange factor GrpE [Prevotella sp.]